MSNNEEIFAVIGTTNMSFKMTIGQIYKPFIDLDYDYNSWSNLININEAIKYFILCKQKYSYLNNMFIIKYSNDNEYRIVEILYEDKINKIKSLL